MKVFENRELRRIVVQKRDGVVPGRSKLNSYELHNLYGSSDVIRIPRDEG
jgi:hypothetical protein